MVNFSNIPAVILAGGKGTRISEYSKNIPKPMVKIKGTPIIDYIIRYYKKFGVKKFYILTGYKSKIIENHFKKKKNISVIYSGQNSMTGGRLLFLKNKIEDNFFCTYGDGISNVNLNRLYNLHLKKKKLQHLQQYILFQDLVKLFLKNTQKILVSFMKNQMLEMIGLMVVFLFLIQKFLILLMIKIQFLSLKH